MDQVRKALAWLKQYHFWVLSLLVAMIALVCWKLGAATLTKEFTTNKGTITGAFTEQTQFRSRPFHPNDDVNTKQLEQIKLQAKNVAAIWQMLYDRQSQGVLTWPAALPERFRTYVEKKNFGDDIPRDLRDHYRDYIERHFETLPKRIGARVMTANETGMGGGEGFGRGYGDRGSYSGAGRSAFMRDEGVPTAGAPDDDYICEWLDQGLVRQELDFPTTPSAMKIWVTQEDLWVYHTLLNIIANTNEAAHADRISNAAVRTIYSLQVGQLAAIASQAKGRVEIIQGPAAADSMFGVEGGDTLGLEGGERGNSYDGGYESSGMRGMGRGSAYGEGGGAMSPEQEKGMLLAGRYVDETGKPLGGGAADTSMMEVGSDLGMPTAELPTGPFKRLPIRMELKMDQRWLTHLISECANQPLPVEVTEVRINPTEGAGGGMGGEGGGRYGGYGGSGFGGGRGGAGGGSSSYQRPINGIGDVLTFKQNPHLGTVVIQGIVTIFKEPDPSVLTVEAGDPLAQTQ